MKIEDKFAMLTCAYEEFMLTGEVKKILLDFHDEKIKKLVVKRMLVNSGDSKKSFNAKLVKDAIDAIGNQIITVTPGDLATSKRLLDALRIPYIDAILEAETTCSHLCKIGQVDAVLSDDTDIIAYSTPVCLSKFDCSTGCCVEIICDTSMGLKDSIPAALALTPNSFLDFCIMCGCDYNKNIAGIGPEKAYKLILNYGTIEEIQLSGIDVDRLNFVRTRELFQEYEKSDAIVGYCVQPNFHELEEFLAVHHMSTGFEYIRKILSYENGIVVV